MPLPPYTADAANAATPTDFVSAGHTAAELRALKERVNTTTGQLADALAQEVQDRSDADQQHDTDILALQDALAQEVTDRGNADQNLQDQISALLPSIAISGGVTRQTVLEGPRDAQGRGQLLAAGAGLTVNIVSQIATDALLANVGAGKEAASGIPQNHGFLVNSVKTWSVPANTTSYLYLEWDEVNSQVAVWSGVVAPYYGIVAPATPDLNAFWYNVNHSGLPQRGDGVAWKDSISVCVGQCTTDASGVTEVITYAYQGKARVVGTTSRNWGFVDKTINNGTTELYRDALSHNLGVNPHYLDYQLFQELIGGGVRFCARAGQTTSDSPSVDGALMCYLDTRSEMTALTLELITTQRVPYLITSAAGWTRHLGGGNGYVGVEVRRTF